MADVIDSGLLYLSLIKQREFTNWDPTAMMTDVLLDAQSTGEGIRECQAASPLVCEIIESSRKRDVSDNELLVCCEASPAQIQFMEIIRSYANTISSDSICQRCYAHRPPPCQPFLWTQ